MTKAPEKIWSFSFRDGKYHPYGFLSLFFFSGFTQVRAIASPPTFISLGSGYSFTITVILQSLHSKE